MYKLIVFLTLFLSSVTGFAASIEPMPCSCSNVTNLQKTAQSPSSFSYAWNHNYTGAQFKVWYTREEDTFTSSFFYTSNLSYNFTGLSTGHYTFYFQALCDGTPSGYIGIEDILL
jgi:hypothetical protein